MMVNLRILNEEIIDYFKFADQNWENLWCSFHAKPITNSQHSINKCAIFFLRNLCHITLNIPTYFELQVIVI